MRALALLATLLFPCAALAQQIPYYLNNPADPKQGSTPVSPATPLPVTGESGGTPIPTVSVPPPTAGINNGTATGTSTTLASLLSGNGNSTNASSWPLSGNAPSNYLVRNLGNSDIAVCPRGGTCTCPENGAAGTTNGYTVYGGGGSYGFNISPSVVAYNVPTAVACSSTDIFDVVQ